MRKNQIAREIIQLRKDTENIHNNLLALERQLTDEKQDKPISCCGFIIQKKKHSKNHEKIGDTDSFESSESCIGPN